MSVVRDTNEKLREVNFIKNHTEGENGLYRGKVFNTFWYVKKCDFYFCEIRSKAFIMTLMMKIIGRITPS